MTKIKNYLVQDGEHHDNILHSSCYPVNLRLLKNNSSYRSLVETIIFHMLNVFQTNFDDYVKLKGLSGANVGVPFNIVILATENEPLVMINPKIVKESENTKIVTSNCGSINLIKPIKVKRFKEVRVSYIPFNQRGTNLFPTIEKTFNISTVQHEIDHNLGILITDKKETK